MPVRVDKAAIQQAIRKHNLYERLGVVSTADGVKPDHSFHQYEDPDDEEPAQQQMEEVTAKSKPKKKKRKGDNPRILQKDFLEQAPTGLRDPLSLDTADDDYYDRDASSIFGATSGASNNTWVECDKCTYLNDQIRLFFSTPRATPCFRQEVAPLARSCGREEASIQVVLLGK